MIKEGLSETYTKFPFLLKEHYLNLEKQAKQNGVGMWKKNEKKTNERPEITKTDLEVAAPKSILETQETKNKKEEANTGKSEAVTEKDTCPTEGIEIHSIFPNNEKGKTHEFIRLINTSDQTICLTGWKLDDAFGSGSKPFEIKRGGMQAKAMRTFRKSETKIALNNSNDCAALINPLNEIVDQICYAKTHKNETFTHNGGNWIPKPKNKGSKSTTKATKQIKQEPVEFQWELANDSVSGLIQSIDEERKMIRLKPIAEEIQISYASSKVDINTTKALIDLSRPIEAKVLSSTEGIQLIGINQKPQKANLEKQEVKRPNHIYILIILLAANLFKGLYKPIKK